MNTLEIARKFAALGEMNEACQAYKLALNECKDKEPAAEFECALHILQFGQDDDYKISYTCFKDLYNQGFAQSDILAIMDEAFYQPNVKMLKKHYEKNCRLLSKYPYLFRKDFLAFDELPIIFFPYDDNKYTPYDVKEQRFGEYINFRHQVISRNFFKDLEKPILAEDVFSQYELEYLNDNVRKSEWVARENHIYLHYTSWPVFCAYLQCLDFGALLKDKKIVFLIEDEIGQYPIDFKERFGIDYSQYKVEPLHIREINRLIWHTQLSSHNGGDFFNEIFDDHPNLLCMPSIMFEKIINDVKLCKDTLAKAGNLKEAQNIFYWQNPRLIAELYSLSNRTEKDILVAMFIWDKGITSPHLDLNSRIVPSIFFQPHFANINYKLLASVQGNALLYSEEYEDICKTILFRDFKYIKTFTPMRRFTTSYGATVKFKLGRLSDEKNNVIDDVVLNRILNRSFMIDWQDRLFKDCRLVRFEDGKLNPKATFTALAAFLDLPYTDSMIYCSLYGKKNPESLSGNDIGFSTAAVFRNYDEYANDCERAFIEYFLRDAYKYYGYDFKYYDEKPVDEKRVQEWLDKFDIINKFIKDSRFKLAKQVALNELKKCREITKQVTSEKEFGGDLFELSNNLVEEFFLGIQNRRWDNIKVLLKGLTFVNKNGQPLHMMPLLKLDPELLEQPLYR